MFSRCNVGYIFILFWLLNFKANHFTVTVKLAKLTNITLDGEMVLLYIVPNNNNKLLVLTYLIQLGQTLYYFSSLSSLY